LPGRPRGDRRILSRLPAPLAVKSLRKVPTDKSSHSEPKRRILGDITNKENEPPTGDGDKSAMKAPLKPGKSERKLGALSTFGAAPSVVPTKAPSVTSARSVVRALQPFTEKELGEVSWVAPEVKWDQEDDLSKWSAADAACKCGGLCEEAHHPSEMTVQQRQEAEVRERQRAQEALFAVEEEHVLAEALLAEEQWRNQGRTPGGASEAVKPPQQQSSSLVDDLTDLQLETGPDSDLDA